ncbi:hypothetical protein WJX64_12775 [Leifsonia sp. YIM 134122]|uniref:HTH marR-type domain-containing protein n=1 Tax=Leifsonia stereocauli TaxID=3134136 RepID=A0ABU9W713_9MICO
MDLVHPGADLIGRAAARVLWQLNETDRAHTGRGIQVEVDVPQRSVQRALDDLASIGLVHSTRIGSAKLHTLNKDHILWPAVLEILESGLRARDLLARSITRVSEGQAALAGYAEEGANTPLALLVIWRNDPGDRDRRLEEFSNEVSVALGNPVEISSFTIEELASEIRDGNPNIDRWERDFESLTSGTPISIHIASARKHLGL